MDRIRAGRRKRSISGSVAIETAAAVGIVGFTMAVLVQITLSQMEVDRMQRGARAAARAIAFDRTEAACAAIGRELGSGSAIECAGQWTVVVQRQVSPKNVAAASAHGAAALPDEPGGKMVVVRIDWILDAVTPGSNNIETTSVGIQRKEW